MSGEKKRTKRASPAKHKRPSVLASFGMSQISSGCATLADYAVLFGMKELLHTWYVPAVASGAAAGSIVNFLINRHWTFDAAHRKAKYQMMRYTLVSAGSLLLNTGGVWVLTEYTGIHYALSVVIVGLVVGIAYNFPLHRAFVFR